MNEKIKVKDKFENFETFYNEIKNLSLNLNFESEKIINIFLNMYDTNYDYSLYKTKILFKNIAKFVNNTYLTIEFWTERGFSEEYAKKFLSNEQSRRGNLQDKKKLKGRFTKDWYKEKYPENWMEKYQSHCEKAKQSKSNFIRRYGEVEGEKKWDEYLKQRSNFMSLQGHIEKYGESIGTAKWNERVEKNRKAVSKEYFISKYGTENGSLKWENRNKNISFKHSKKYYIQKYGKEEGLKKLSNLKAQSLNRFINIYGEDEGNQRWEKYMIRLGEREQIKYSLNSFNLFNSLNITDSFFGENEKTIYLKKEDRIKLNQYCIKPDFLFEKKIIEFLGDYWHANPLKFKSEDILNLRQTITTAKEIWKKDKTRIEILEGMGYKCLIVWENEYNNDKEKTIKKCLDFINDL